MRTDAPLRISGHVRFIRMDDQIIVADLRSGRYLGLDGVGARAWDLIGKRATRGAIVDCLCGEYDASADVIERDVERLLRDLLERRLIEQAPSPGHGPAVLDLGPSRWNGG